MKTFIFPGSFDPFSLGHLDVARRAANLCDRLLVAVMQNRSKNYLFTIDERVEMATRCLNMFPSIEVISYDKLLKNAKQRNRALFDKLFAPKASDLKHPENLQNS